MTTKITNNQFYGVKWEGLALEVLKDVSQALLNLTELFKAQNFDIECLLKVVSPEKVGGDEEGEVG